MNGGVEKMAKEAPWNPSGQSIRSFAFILMVGLSIWVGAVTIFIEAKNVEAGSYLPRKRHVDAGKWRVSREGTPQDELRATIKSVGLVQYPLSVLLISLAAFHLAVRRSISFARFAAASGVTALGLAIYRGYYSSLGW